MIAPLAFMLMSAAATSMPCENLTSVKLDKATIASAQSVPEGPAPARGGGRGQARAGGAPATPAPPPPMIPAHCRVQLVLKPSSDSLINMELWLPPADKWNGKFQAIGNGGWAGSIQGLTQGMPAALSAGYATAGNDTGHEGAIGVFALGHPEKLKDFADRAMHEMTVQSKALVKAFYDRSAQLSYYNGCSTGGRQGLMAAQRWPEDFDAIIAGAPANEHTYLHAGDIARMTDIYKDPEGYIPQEKQTVLAKAVMNACDASDGVKDNLITN